MPRPLRIQYPDTWYHIMNRGRRGEKILSSKEDYQFFITLLKELNEVYNVLNSNLLPDGKSLPPPDKNT